MYVIGLVVLVIAIISIFKSLVHRVTVSNQALKEQIARLETRVNELEKEN